MALVSQPNLDVSQQYSPLTFQGRLIGLDAIRYICAAWVVLNHMGTPFRSLQSHGLIWKLASSIFQAAISGPAAVIVFFVISGLCIHFNYRNGKAIDYFSYYMRRYIRIGIPLCIVLILTFVSAHKGFHSLTIASLNDSVLWSLIAELIYYTIYPVLMFAKRRFGWRPLILAAFAASYLVVLSHPRLAIEGYYPLYGWKLNWILGLPCWLLGCLLAERIQLSKSIDLSATQPKASIWTWRIAVWATSCVTILLQFHQHGRHIHLGYSLTLNLFAIVVFFWLRNEILYFQSHQPLLWLEKAGAGSYSLYLIHPLLLGVLGNYQVFLGDGILRWIVTFCEIVIMSTLFYFLVEKPSHALARLFRPRKQSALPPTFASIQQ